METNQDFEIEGMDVILNAMDELPAVLQQKIIRKVIFKAGRKFIVSELRAALSYSSKLKKALRVVNYKQDKTSVIAGVIISKRKGDEIPPGLLIRFIDAGTVQRTTRKGYNRGAIKARNEVPPIIDRQKAPMLQWVKDEMGNEINLELDKLLAKKR